MSEDPDELMLSPADEEEEQRRPPFAQLPDIDVDFLPGGRIQEFPHGRYVASQ